VQSLHCVLRDVLSEECSDDPFSAVVAHFTRRPMAPTQPATTGIHPSGDGWYTSTGDEWYTPPGDEWYTPPGDDWYILARRMTI
jgi:hypothetical protein